MLANSYVRALRIARWALFSPAAVLACALVGLGATKLLGAAIEPSTSDLRTALVLLGALYALQGAALVFVGALVAPSHERAIAWLLTALLFNVAFMIAIDHVSETYYSFNAMLSLPSPAGRISDLLLLGALPAGGLATALLFRGGGAARARWLTRWLAATRTQN